MIIVIQLWRLCSEEADNNKEAFDLDDDYDYAWYKKCVNGNGCY